MTVNYGFNTMRLPTPVPVGSRIQMTASLQQFTAVPGGLQITVERSR